MKPNLWLLGLTLAGVLTLSGCKPDELEFTVYSSDLEQAEKGELVEVPLTARFSMVGKDEKGVLQQARELAKQWLPEDCRFEVTAAQFGDKLSVETKVPMIAKSKAQEVIQAKRPVLYLEVDQGVATLRRTQHLDVLGRELRRINAMLGVSLPARSTIISLVGERPPKSMVVEATAVFVNDRAVLHMREPVVNRRTLNIRFSGQDGSVYKDYERVPPSFRLSGG